MIRTLISVLVAAFVSAAVGRSMIYLGPAKGWIDRPDDPDLKSHQVEAVPLGGIGLWLAVNLASILAGNADLSLAIASLLLLGLGLLDDRRSLHPRIRLLAEAVAGLILGAGRSGGLLEALAVAALVVIAVNAVNLFDGLDGLAGLSGLTAALGIAALAAVRDLDPSFGLVVAAAVAGFLCWNWHPARLFLGDNGAYVLAVFLVAGISRASPTPGSLLVAAALLGVFLIDMGATVLRRILVSQPMFSRDRLHLYDRLAAKGFPIPLIAGASAALEAVVAVAVVLADDLLPSVQGAVSLLLFGAGLVILFVWLLGAARPGYWTNQ